MQTVLFDTGQWTKDDDTLQLGR